MSSFPSIQTQTPVRTWWSLSPERAAMMREFSGPVRSNAAFVQAWRARQAPRPALTVSKPLP